MPQLTISTDCQVVVSNDNAKLTYDSIATQLRLISAFIVVGQIDVACGDL